MRTMIYLAALFLVGAGVSACNDDGETDPKTSTSVCGDDVCDADESFESCPADCPEFAPEDPCGDGVCDADESFESCPEDCPPPLAEPRCGDGICDDNEDEDTCAIDCDEEYDDGATCVAVYNLNLTMEIADTPAKAGDSVNEDLVGQLALRYRQSDQNDEIPADDTRVEILHYFVRNELVSEVTIGSPMTITTTVHGFTPTCNGDTDIADKKNLPDSCDFEPTRDTEAKATGVYRKDDDVVVWQRCDPPAAYYSPDASADSYTPDHVAEGPGCLADYHSQGNVYCDGNLCSTGGLENGDNIQDDSWNQPLEKFTLSADGEEVELARTRIPNRDMGNTFVSFTGTRSTLDCE